MAFVAGGYFAATQIDAYKDWKKNRDQLLVEDYIRLHPEDFPLVSKFFITYTLILRYNTCKHICSTGNYVEKGV